MALLHYAAAFILLFTVVEAAMTTESVHYADGSTNLSGFVAYPAGAGPFPVVLHVHAWTGLSDFEKQRANRTAEELGYIGFAVSIFDENETTKAAASMQNRFPIVQKYNAAPELIVSRLSAAVTFVKQHAKADSNKISAVGYCFGGSAVLQFARLGGAKQAGVHGVASFHGGLGGVSAPGSTWNGTKVLILNGAADNQIPKSDVDATQASLTAAGVTWEFTNYGHADHGFTHPKDGSNHFHYEEVAEERSWTSMTDFLGNSLGFKVTEPVTEQLTSEKVTYMDGDVTLTGYVVYKEGSVGPLPVILHVHAWTGLSDFEKHRANRTAEELGYIGFAVSVFDDDESAQAAASMQNRIPLVQKYNAAPELIVSRLSAAVTFVKQHAKADSNKISAVGYCFGGSAVLQFARLGGAEDSGVGSVVSFHGSLGGIAGMESNFCPTRVAVYNGASDQMISDAELMALQQALETTKTFWELTNYSFSGHGFTHPREAGNDHFHFEKTAESRSWVSMAHFLKDSFAGKGQASSANCVKFVPEKQDGTEDDNNDGNNADCMDDDAAVAEAAGAWGVTQCAEDLCEGQYKDMMQPLCRKTCGLCGTDCMDDDAAVAEAAGAWGVTQCAENLCEGQYKDMIQPLCRKTCGLCGNKNTDCMDDDAAVAEAAGAWGVTQCAENLCEGQYKDMMQPLCRKTCGLCTTDESWSTTTSTTTVEDSLQQTSVSSSVQIYMPVVFASLAACSLV